MTFEELLNKYAKNIAFGWHGEGVFSDAVSEALQEGRRQGMEVLERQIYIASKQVLTGGDYISPQVTLGNMVSMTVALRQKIQELEAEITRLKAESAPAAARRETLEQAIEVIYDQLDRTSDAHLLFVRQCAIAIRQLADKEDAP